MRDNAARDKAGEPSPGENMSVRVAEGVLLDKNGTPETDLTDKEDRRFRYSY